MERKGKDYSRVESNLFYLDGPKIGGVGGGNVSEGEWERENGEGERIGNFGINLHSLCFTCHSITG